MNSIKFNQQGIEAILNGSKTMTRRPIKDELKQPSEDHYLDAYNKGFNWYWWTKDGRQNLSQEIKCKYKVGETVYIDEEVLKPYDENDTFLKITNIKVERLQDISLDDCVDEGVEGNGVSLFTQDKKKIKDVYVNNFKVNIWNNLPYKAPYDWNSNPYVFVYELKVVK